MTELNVFYVGIKRNIFGDTFGKIFHFYSQFTQYYIALSVYNISHRSFTNKPVFFVFSPSQDRCFLIIELL